MLKSFTNKTGPEIEPHTTYHLKTKPIIRGVVGIAVAGILAASYFAGSTLSNLGWSKGDTSTENDPSRTSYSSGFNNFLDAKSLSDDCKEVREILTTAPQDYDPSKIFAARLSIAESFQRVDVNDLPVECKEVRYILKIDLDRYDLARLALDYMHLVDIVVRNDPKELDRIRPGLKKRLGLPPDAEKQPQFVTKNNRTDRLKSKYASGIGPVNSTVDNLEPCDIVQKSLNDMDPNMLRQAVGMYVYQSGAKTITLTKTEDSAFSASLLEQICEFRVHFDHLRFNALFESAYPVIATVSADKTSVKIKFTKKPVTNATAGKTSP